MKDAGAAQIGLTKVLSFSVPHNDGAWTEIKITQKELSRLGEGAASVVYNYMTENGHRYAIKIFKSPDKAPWDKLIFIKNKYAGSAQKALEIEGWATLAHGIKYSSIAWPISIVHSHDTIATLANGSGALVDEKRIGIVLPFLDPAEWLTLDHWIEFHLLKKLGNERNSLSQRLQLLRNISVALGELHASHIAMVDVKPANICVERKSGRACLLDVDSFRVCGDGTIYPATHASPGYILPRELSSVVNVTALDEVQDRYAYAVIAFQILNYGIHPFQNISLDTHDEDNTFDAKARRYLYAYGDKGHSPSLQPMRQSVHECWPTKFRTLLASAFRDGDTPATMNQWTTYLDEFVNRNTPKLVACLTHPSDPSHIHFDGYACMACTRASQVKMLKERHPSKSAGAKAQRRAGEREQRKAAPIAWRKVIAGALILAALGSALWLSSSGKSPRPSAISEDQASSPSSLTFNIKNHTSRTVAIAFYSQMRDHSWPEENRPWVVPASQERSHSLQCLEGEEICYGAWLKNDSTKGHWGKGIRGQQACLSKTVKCCYECNGDEIDIPLDKR